MISIIFPVYNVERYLRSSIKSCLSQSYSDFELIAINDGSRDGSLSILKEFQKEDSRIRIIDQSNQGVAKARLVGVECALGDYIMFVDSDDLLPVDALFILYNELTASDADISMGSYIEVYDQCGYESVCTLSQKKELTSSEYLELVLTQKIQWGLCAKLYKKALFQHLDNSFWFLHLGEDASLLVQLIMMTKKVALTKNVVYYYLQRDNSASHLNSSPHVKDIFVFRLWICDYLTKIGYDNITLINQFVVTGYVECLLQGGAYYLSKDDLILAREKYSNIRYSLSLWQRLLFISADIKGVNKAIAWILRKMKYYMFQVKIKRYNI